jgi:hypothetical protein
LEGVGLKLEDNIKIGLKEICWNSVDWVNLAQDSDKWRESLNAVMKLCVPQNAVNVSVS